MKKISLFMMLSTVFSLLLTGLLIKAEVVNYHNCEDQNKWNITALFVGDGDDSTPPTGTCCPDNCYDPNCNTTTTFNLNLAAKLVNNYRNNHWCSINANCPSVKNIPDNMDSRSAWFSLETLKGFINVIETNSCFGPSNSDCPKLELGIRIYYGEYPTNATELAEYNNPNFVTGANNKIIPADYAGLHTLIMVPTYHDDTKGIDIDFDPVSFDKTKCTPTSIFDTMGIVTNFTALAPPVTGQNHGGLAPPPDDCNGPNALYNNGVLFMKYVDRIYSTTTPTCDACK